MSSLSERCAFPSLHALDFIACDFGTRDSAPPSDVVTVHQIHSAHVHFNRGQHPSSERVDADALIENTPGVAIGIKTADCVPILLADPVRRVVAAVHAGWRGTAAGIVPAAIRSMTAEFSTRPEDVHAAIGPSIGPCCYEVGPEVAAEFGVIPSSRVHLDLPALNAAQLRAAGVTANHISIARLCTKCLPEAYHSFRRDQEAAGRMISWIRINP